MANNLRLTELAAEKVKEISANEGIDEFSLRIKVQGGGCAGFIYDISFARESAPNDTIIESHGVKLIVDEMSLMYLRETEVDYVDGLQGAGFKFNNPLTRATCGCGMSFS